MQTAQLHYQLETLTSSGLLRQLLSEPELEYIFKHALTHEATY